MSQFHAAVPMHPGALLRTKLENLDCTRAAAARFMQLSRQTLYEIIAEKQSVTPSAALRIAKLTGTSPKSWLDMQQAHDLETVRLRDAEILKSVPELGERW